MERLLIHYSVLICIFSFTTLSGCRPTIHTSLDDKLSALSLATTAETPSSTPSFSPSLSISFKTNPGVTKTGETLSFSLGISHSTAKEAKEIKLQYASDGLNFVDVSANSTIYKDTTEVAFTLPAQFTSTRTGKFRLAATSENAEVVYSQPTDAVSVVTEMATLSGSLTNLGVSFSPVSQARMGAPMALLKIGNDLYFGTGGIIGKLNLTDAQNPIFSIAAGSVSSTGTSDGVGTAARVNSPRAFASDGTHLFFTQGSDHIIRKLNLSTGQVTTIAGTAGTAGSTNGNTSVATFDTPRGLAIHGTTLYVNEQNRIRKMEYDSNSDSYTVSTIAGASSGFINADGTAARLSTIIQIAISTDGTKLYAAEAGNKVIREISTVSPYTVSVLAGGSVSSVSSTTLIGVHGLLDGVGSAARFYYPYGLWLTGDYLFVADWNCSIRKIFVGSAGGTYGEVSTVAGNGECGNTNSSNNAEVRMDLPYSIFADSNEVYVGEFIGRIRKIDRATGATSMVLGSSQTLEEVMQGRSAGFNNITYLANDGTDIYVSDLNSVIRKYNPTQKTVSYWAGVPGAQDATTGTLSTAKFSYAGMVKVGTDWYVTNYMYNVIQRIDSSGNVSIVAGTYNSVGTDDGVGTAAKFNRPWYIAAIGTDVFVADIGQVSGSNNFRIRRIDTANSYAVTTIAGSTAGFTDDTDEAGATSSGRFNNIRGMVAHGTSLYITDLTNHAIRRIDLSNMAIPKVSTVIGATGTPTAAYLEGTGNAARLTSPAGLATDGSFLYFFDTGTNNCRIRKASLTTFETSFIAGSGTCGSTNAIGNTARVAADITHLTVFGGELYFSALYFIRKVNLSTTVVSTVAGQTAPTGILPDYANCTNTSCAATIYRMMPTNITKLGNYFYATDPNNHVIWKIAPDGTRSVFAGLSGEAGEARGNLTNARLNGPAGIATDGTHLYITEAYGSIVTKIDMNTETVSTIGGLSQTSATIDGDNSNSRFTTPYWIAYYNGNLFITQTDFKIRKLEISTETTSTWVGTGTAGNDDGQGTLASIQSISNLAVSGNYLYMSESGQGRVRKINLDDATVTTLFTKDINQSVPIRLAAQGDYLYYYDSKAYSVVKHHIPSQTETTLVGGYGDSYYSEVNGSLNQSRLYNYTNSLGVWDGEVVLTGVSSLRVIR